MDCMDGWKQWRGPDELLELFGINADASRWASIWCGLVVTLAMGVVYPDYGIDMHAVERAWLRDASVSPVVFWGRIKSTLRPLLEADFDTLAALGLRPYDRTGRALARAAAEAMASDGWTGDEETAAQLARLLRGLDNPS